MWIKRKQYHRAPYCPRTNIYFLRRFGLRGREKMENWYLCRARPHRFVRCFPCTDPVRMSFRNVTARRSLLSVRNSTPRWWWRRRGKLATSDPFCPLEPCIIMHTFGAVAGHDRDEINRVCLLQYASRSAAERVGARVMEIADRSRSKTTRVRGKTEMRRDRRVRLKIIILASSERFAW